MPTGRSPSSRQERCDLTPALQAVGAELRAARLARGEDLADIAAYLRIQPRFLQALETGDIAATPGRPYALGFARSYADHLQLDGRALAAAIKPALPAAVPDAVPTHRLATTESRGPTARSMIASLVLVAAVFGGYRYYHRQHDAAPQPSTAAAPPSALAAGPMARSESIVATLPVDEADVDVTSAVAAEAAPAVLVSLETGAAHAPVAEHAEGRVVLLARASSWVQLRNPDRSFVRSRTLQPGERLIVPERAGLTLATSNGGDLEILVDGQSTGPAGASGQVVRDLDLTPDSLRTRPVAAH